MSASAETIRVYYPPITDDLNSFKKFIMSNPTTIDYILATQQEETIELPNIPTHTGTTVIEIDTTIQPSAVQYQYYKGGK
jgi:hypothetical protein